MLGAMATAADADPFTLWAQIDGGGMYGTGTSGAAKSDAYFANAPPGVYGAEIGAEIFMVNLWIDHHQHTDGSRLTTWTKFGLGLHYEMDFVQQPIKEFDATEKKANKKKKDEKQLRGGFAELALGAFFGLGTGQQVDPPLDNSEITDKAFQIEARVGIGTHLNNVFDVGILVPVSYGLFIKNGAGVVANDLDNHYRGIQAEALLYLRANIRLF